MFTVLKGKNSTKTSLSTKTILQKWRKNQTVTTNKTWKDSSVVGLPTRADAKGNPSGRNERTLDSNPYKTVKNMGKVNCVGWLGTDQDDPQKKGVFKRSLLLRQ